MGRGIPALLLLVVLIGGFAAFSLYAHDKVDQSRAVNMGAQLEELQQKHDQLQNSYQAQGKRFARDRQRWEDTLYVMFPGDENRDRIHTLFHGDVEESDEEEPVGDDGPEPTDDEQTDAADAGSEDGSDELTSVEG